MPFGAAHTYIAHIREYPPPPPPGSFAQREIRFALHNFIIQALRLCRVLFVIFNLLSMTRDVRGPEQHNHLHSRKINKLLFTKPFNQLNILSRCLFTYQHSLAKCAASVSIHLTRYNELDHSVRWFYNRKSWPSAELRNSVS